MMLPGVDFDHENPRTVHDILWSWSFGYMTNDQTIRSLGLDDLSELYQTAHDNDVAYPRAPSTRDIQQATDFVASIKGAA